MRHRCLAGAAGLLAITLIALPTLSASEWPRFRGADDGVAPDHTDLPETWSETENVKWRADIPGLGWSSPIVWDDHVIVTTAISAGEEPQPVKGLYDPGDEHGKQDAVAAHRWVVYDIDLATGAVRWERELRSALPPIKRHLKSSFASETPVTDGERVYVYFGSIGLVAALELVTGEVVWTQDVGAFNGGQEFAPAASPVLHDGRLYVVNDNTTESFLIAFDAETGERMWRMVREETENWSTPFVWENRLRTELVTTGRRRVRSYDLDGNVLWELQGMTGNVAPTPFAKNDLAYLSSGYPGSAVRPVYAVRPGGSGDISLDPGQPDRPSLHRLVPADARHVRHLGARLPGHLLHAARPGDAAGARRRHRRGDLRPDTAPPRQRLHGVALGVQRPGLRPERGRRHLRHPAGPRVRDPRRQPAQRDDAGDARGGGWQPDHPDADEAVQSLERGAAGERAAAPRRTPRSSSPPLPAWRRPPRRTPRQSPSRPPPPSPGRSTWCGPRDRSPT